MDFLLESPVENESSRDCAKYRSTCILLYWHRCAMKCRSWSRNIITCTWSTTSSTRIKCTTTYQQLELGAEHKLKWIDNKVTHTLVFKNLRGRVLSDQLPHSQQVSHTKRETSKSGVKIRIQRSCTEIRIQITQEKKMHKKEISSWDTSTITAGISTSRTETGQWQAQTLSRQELLTLAWSWPENTGKAGGD